MTKGGGRGKGRPRKRPETVFPPQLETSVTDLGVAGCSTTVKSGSGSELAEEELLVQHMIE